MLLWVKADIMTNLATVLGALPIALAIGSAGKSRIPLGLVIIGGLLFVLILTLYRGAGYVHLFITEKKVNLDEEA